MAPVSYLVIITDLLATNAFYREFVLFLLNHFIVMVLVMVLDDGVGDGAVGFGATGFGDGDSNIFHANSSSVLTTNFCRLTLKLFVE